MDKAPNPARYAPVQSVSWGTLALGLTVGAVAGQVAVNRYNMRRKLVKHTNHSGPFGVGVLPSPKSKKRGFIGLGIVRW